MQKIPFTEITNKDLCNNNTSFNLMKIRHLYYGRENEFIHELKSLFSDNIMWINEKTNHIISNSVEEEFTNNQIQLFIHHVNDIARLYASNIFNEFDEIDITPYASEIIGSTGDTIKILQGYYGLLARTNLDMVKTTLIIKSHTNRDLITFKSALTHFFEDTKRLQVFVNNLKTENIGFFADINALLLTFTKYLHTAGSRLNCSNLISLIQMGRNVKYYSITTSYELLNPIWEYLKIKSDDAIGDYSNVSIEFSEEHILNNALKCLNNINPYTDLNSIVLIISNNNKNIDLLNSVLTTAYQKGVKIEIWFWYSTFSNRNLKIFDSFYRDNVKFRFLNIFNELLIFYEKSIAETKPLAIASLAASANPNSKRLRRKPVEEPKAKKVADENAMTKVIDGCVVNYLPLEIYNKEALSLCEIALLKINDNSNEAIQCFEASVIFVKNKTENKEFKNNDLAIIYSLIGYTYYVHEKYDNSFKNFLKSFEYLKNGTNVKSIVAISYIIMGFYLTSNKYAVKTFNHHLLVNNLLISISNKSKLESAKAESSTEVDTIVIDNKFYIDFIDSMYNYISKQPDFKLCVDKMNKFYEEHSFFKNKNIKYKNILKHEYANDKLKIITNTEVGKSNFIIAKIPGVNDDQFE